MHLSLPRNSKKAPQEPKRNLGGFLDSHIRELCREHKIKRTVKPGRGHAQVAKRMIQHPPIRDDVMAYFVALHEIGHVVNGMKPPSRLEREAAAWTWALEHSLLEPHYSIRQRICALLVRYIFRARENNWKLPEDDSDYYKLLVWW